MTPSPLSRAQLAGRLSLIGLAVAGLAGAFAWTAGWIGPQRLTPQRIIDTFEANAGHYPGYRKNHAKGLCISGQFQSSGAVAAYSRAQVFAPGDIPVTGRLAIGGSNPFAADASVPVRSLALRLRSADGQEWRTGMNTPAVLAVGTVEAFFEQVLASAPDPVTGKPNPAKVQAFFDAHPESAAFRQWAQTNKPSNSFANARYHGLNAFRLVNAEGQARYVRWAMVPEAPYEPLDAQVDDPDFLAHDLHRRLAQGPLRWHLVLTLAEDGDPVDDPSRAWPAERQQVEAGTLVIDRAQPEDQGDCRDINFDPLVLPDGIEPSADPILAARSAAYAVSFNRRTHEGAPAPRPGAQP
ncbi:catalase family peroxidase [Metapseudomonas otitidis]|uniref:catalase family peroxidase n=1 Tax=Metapseudomonas otitidis TaxID=319939 RepID=UPI00280A6089|nr:catalase family peroxidase [Pseudomonas otitidis]